MDRSRREYYGGVSPQENIVTTRIEEGDVVFVADLHLHNRPAWKVDWYTRFFKELEPACAVAFLGDVFELRDNIPVVVVDLFLDFVIGCSRRGVELCWITGQHDSVVPGRACFRAARQLPGVTVVDEEPARWREYTCIPFARDASRQLAMFREAPAGTKILTHITTRESVGSGISIKELPDVPIFSGDLHVSSSFSLGTHSLVFVGAPLQRDFRDQGVVGTIFVNERPVRTRHPVFVTGTADEIEKSRDAGVEVFARADADPVRVRSSVPKIDVDPHFLIRAVCSDEAVRRVGLELYSQAAA